MGCISFREDYFLADSRTSYVRRRRISRLLAHELSHLWLGNCTTPLSFDQLWIKEGLARYVEFVVVEALWPDRKIWESFLLDVFFQSMMHDADLNKSHPVEQNHHNEPRMVAAIPPLNSEALMKIFARLVAGAPYQNMTR